MVARSSYARLETPRRRLSSQPRDRATDRKCCLPIRAAGDRLHARSKTDDVHVRGKRTSQMKPSGQAVCMPVPALVLLEMIRRSAAGHAHVACEGRALVPPIDDEIMSLGL